MKNHIGAFVHCRKCLKEKPSHISPADWARLEVGYTEQGFQVWCVRHDLNVLALDFMGQKVGYDDEANYD